MDALSIDAACQPRAYRLRDRCIEGTGNPQVAGIVVGVILAIAGGALLWKAWTVFDSFRTIDVWWIAWAMIQFGFGVACIIGTAFLCFGLLLAGSVSLYAIRPSVTTWRLDGSGLYGVSELGLLRLDRPRFYPFERIAIIRHVRDSVSIFLWQDGKAVFEKDIAKGLPPEKAAGLAACLNEDLAAARALWQEQGLIIVPHPPAAAPAGPHPA